MINIKEKYLINSEYLKKKMIDKCGSVQHFARYSEIPQETIYFWLRQERMPSDKLFFLCDLLSITDLKKLRKESDANEQEGT